MQILGQSTGNITSQRTYIHRELGADSLRQPIPLSAGVDEARGRAWRGRNGGAETEVKIENSTTLWFRVSNNIYGFRRDRIIFSPAPRTCLLYTSDAADE